MKRNLYQSHLENYNFNNNNYLIPSHMLKQNSNENNSNKKVKKSRKNTFDFNNNSIDSKKNENSSFNKNLNNKFSKFSKISKESVIKEKNNKKKILLNPLLKENKKNIENKLNLNKNNLPKINSHLLNNDKNLNEKNIIKDENYFFKRNFNNNLDKKIEINNNNLNNKESFNKIETKNLINKISNIQENNKNNNINFNNFNNNKENSYSNSEVSSIITNLIGLNNLGNTCFMNTCLQNLIHCSYFISELLNIKEKNPKNKLTNSFINLCNIYKNSKTSISPNNFRLIFCQNHFSFGNYGQHDTVEFLRNLLEDLSKELNIVKKIPCYKELKDEGKTKKEQMIEYNEYFLSRENSIIIKIFYPLIINVFICECGFETYSFERILDIPLLLPKNNNNLSVDLMSLIRNYFEGDEFKWETKCKKCKIKNKMHKKKIFLTILPKILILSIQRFNIINKSKSNKSIKLYEKINLKNFVDEELIENYSNFDYKLFGISNHSGSLNFGHYYAYVNIQGKWKEFNDSFVTNVNFSSVSTTAYALFYEKC